MSTQKISLTEYGPPPEIPSVDDIIEDIGKASQDDIVFKSSSAVEKLPTTDEEKLLSDTEKDSTDISLKDDRNSLNPNMAYKMSLKLLERQEASISLLKTLDDHEESLNSLKDKITRHLERLNQAEK